MELPKSAGRHLAKGFMANIVRVWDAPTRLFHWALVVCVVGLALSSQLGGVAMEWHFRFGYGVLALLLFRLVWGFMGGHWSRFGSFLYAPGRVVQYMKGQGSANESVGHNPLGALSVFALLLFLALQVGSGLFSDDEIAAAGPLTRFVSGGVVGSATYYHKEIGKLILLALVFLHVAAVISYWLIKHTNLIKPMITGDKLLDFPAQNATDTAGDRIKALMIFSAWCAAVASLVVWLR